MASPLKSPTRRSSNYNPTGRITENLNNDTTKNNDINARLNQANFEKYQVIGKKENVSPPLSSIQSLLSLFSTDGPLEEKGCDLWLWSPDMNVGVPTPQMYEGSNIANRYKLAFSHKAHIRNQDSVSELKPNDILSGMCANINSLNDFVPLEMFAGSVANAGNSSNQSGSQGAMANGSANPLVIAKELDATKVGVSETTPVSNDFAFFVEPCKSNGVASPWGVRFHPTKKKRKMHQGIDTKTPQNNILYATYDGVVSDIVQPTSPSVMGTIKIVHTINNVLPNKKITLQNSGGDGYVDDTEVVDLIAGKYISIYYHVFKIEDKIKNGVTVKTGEIIGLSGGDPKTNGSGGPKNSTGAHLHYELRYGNNGKNKSFNPFEVVAWGSIMQGNRAATTKEAEEEKLKKLQEKEAADAALKAQQELVARDATVLLADATAALASGDTETARRMVNALIEKSKNAPLGTAIEFGLTGLKIGLGL